MDCKLKNCFKHFVAWGSSGAQKFKNIFYTASKINIRNRLFGEKIAQNPDTIPKLTEEEQLENLVAKLDGLVGKKILFTIREKDKKLSHLLVKIDKIEVNNRMNDVAIFFQNYAINRRSPLAGAIELSDSRSSKSSLREDKGYFFTVAPSEEYFAEGRGSFCILGLDEILNTTHLKVVEDKLIEDYGLRYPVILHPMIIRDAKKYEITETNYSATKSGEIIPVIKKNIYTEIDELDKKGDKEGLLRKLFNLTQEDPSDSRIWLELGILLEEIRPNMPLAIFNTYKKAYLSSKYKHPSSKTIDKYYEISKQLFVKTGEEFYRDNALSLLEERLYLSNKLTHKSEKASTYRGIAMQLKQLGGAPGRVLNLLYMATLNNTLNVYKLFDTMRHYNCPDIDIEVVLSDLYEQTGKDARIESKIKAFLAKK